MMRSGKKLSDMDRSFDIEFWQRQGDRAIFEAAWEMVIEAHQMKGGNPDDLKMDKSVERFVKIRGYSAEEGVGPHSEN